MRTLTVQLMDGGRQVYSVGDEFSLDGITEASEDPEAWLSIFTTDEKEIEIRLSQVALLKVEVA